jgi:dTDP-4-amino-4,6-dideoxygalactose transaminase
MLTLIMKPNRIWLSPPHMGGSEIKYINEAFNLNWIAPMGDNVNAFENLLEQRVGKEFAVALSSGTSALHLSLITLGVNRGDIVLCQDLTFASCAFSITYLGAEPVFIDSEMDTWNMDPHLLLEAVKHYTSKGRRIAAIVLVHLYGMPAKMDEIMAIAEEYAIPVIEDAAEALGSTYKDKPLGSMGATGVLSFNGNKIITTSGGGALLCNDRKIAYQAKHLASQAREPFIHYEHEKIGYNYRMSNILAGIGRGQMEVLDERVNARRKNFIRYEAYFSNWNKQGFEIVFQPEMKGSYSNRWLTTLMLDPSKNNYMSYHTIMLALENDNIESRPTWKPMHMQPVYKDAAFFGNGVAEKIFSQGICLPSGSSLTDNDFDRIFSMLDGLFKRYL